MNIFDEIFSANQGNLDKPAMSITPDNGDRRAYTYRQTFDAAEIFAERLRGAGVVPGDRVVFMGENSPEWDIAWLAVLCLRATAVLVDASLPGEELLRLLKRSDARGLFTSPGVLEKLGEGTPRDIPVMNLYDGARPFAGCAARVSEALPPTPDPDEETAMIIYSSGTTRAATGIMQTHDAMLGTTRAAMEFNRLKNDERMLVVIPSSHIYGVVTCMLGPMLLGSSLHFIGSLTAENVLAAFAEFRPTVFPCIPKVFETFQKQIAKKIDSKAATRVLFHALFPFCVWLRQHTGINLGKLVFGSVQRGFGGAIRIFCAAGAPMDRNTALFYYGTGFNLFINYGLTESNVPVIANCYENYHIDSCGKPYPHVELMIKAPDEQGGGELYLKTPFMMKGYFRDAEATREAFEDGWLKTGDLAAYDSGGNVRLIGRCKDNIVLSTGKKVCPDEVECAYENISGIRELVVCAVPVSTGAYDEIHAFAVCEQAESESGLEAIRRAVFARSAQLSQYLKIARLHIVEEIPKTALQKPKRYLLRLLALGTAAKPSPQETPDGKADPLEEVIGMIRRCLKTDVAISGQTRVAEELGMDSLAQIELDVLIEERFGHSIASAFVPGVTVETLVAAIGQGNGTQSDASLYPLTRTRRDFRRFRFAAKVLGWLYPTRVTGLDRLAHVGPCLLCANHQSNLDYLWVASRFSERQYLELHCLAKKELFNSGRLSRRLVQTCGLLPIDRGGPDAHALSRCEELLEQGKRLLIYPEGTRTSDGQLGEIKPGAAALAINSSLPIIPVQISGAFEIFPRGRKLPHLFDLAHARRYRVNVDFAEPIFPENKTTEQVTHELAAALGQTQPEKALQTA